jgi:regulator of protease activity HflC (stomatin/prohibitin superfamily)
MSYRVLEDPNVPRGMEAIYAQQAVATAQARAKAAQERREAESERQQAIKDNLAEIEKDSQKRAAETAEHERELAAKRLDQDLETAFFTANPSADEQTFKRLLPSLRDEHMKQATMGQFTDIKAKLKASGRYIL